MSNSAPSMEPKYLTTLHYSPPWTRRNQTKSYPIHLTRCGNIGDTHDVHQGPYMATTCLTRTLFIISEILFLVLIHICREVVSSMPWLHYPEGKNPQHPQNGRLEWASKSVWMFWRTEKLLTQITPPLARSLQQLGYPTSTSQYKAHRIMIHLKTRLFLIPQMPSIRQLTKFQIGKLWSDPLHKDGSIILVVHPLRPYCHHGISSWYGLLPL